MSIEISGFFGLLVFIADVWAILNVVQSSATMGKKLIWVLLILFLPLLGVIIWWLAGPRTRS